MKRRQSAFTLTEILAVIAIVAILATTLGLVLAPRIKARATESRIMNDLHQISVGTNLYISENDGGFPPRFTASRVPNVPVYCEGCSRFSPVPFNTPEMMSPTVKNPYIYHWPRGYWKLDELAEGKLRYHYDPTTYPIFSAPWYRKSEAKEQVEFFSGPGQFTVYTRWPVSRVPAVRLDGSVFWKREPENWQMERAGSIGLLMRSR